MKLCALVLELLLPQNFCHTHTDRQTFSRNSQFGFRTSQTSKSIKNWESKISTKTIFSSIHVVESKKEEKVGNFIKPEKA